MATTLLSLALSSLLISVVLFCKISSKRRSPILRSHKKFVYRSLAFLIGFSSSLVLNLLNEDGFIDLYSDRGNFLKSTLRVQPAVLKNYEFHFRKEIKAEELSLFNENQSQSGRRTIWFLTVTDFSMVQTAKLTSIGQALFPFRDFVVWVIIKDENEFANEAISNSTSERIISTVERFGIPFVLLKRKTNLVAELGNGGKHYVRFDTDIKVVGLQTGLVWLLQNVKSGILMLAEDDFTFDHHIFPEVLKTTSVSVWPIGLYDHYNFIFSPIVNNNGNISGYFSYDGMELDSMKIVRGGFAIDVEYMKNLDHKMFWKLTYDGHYDFKDIGIPLADVKPIAARCTKIYVWKTHIGKWPWPKKKSLKVKSKYNSTSLMKLLKKCYNYKFSDIVKPVK